MPALSAFTQQSTRDSASDDVERTPSPRSSQKVDWTSSSLIFIPPLLVLWALLSGEVAIQGRTLLLGSAFWLFHGLGISAGYHRLFSHRAYTASVPLQWVLLFAGAGAFEGSAKWWSRNHRIHHRYVDTDLDPYNAKRGFWFTHLGWMIVKQDYSRLGRVDVDDFKNDKAIQFQHRHYLSLAFLSGIICPTVIAGLGWGDWLGGYFYAALLKMVVLHHCTFFINSLAHFSFFGGIQNFSDQHSSFDSLLCAFLTLGEGYHNFHHEFAQDYRNGIKWYHYDPTKWFIRGCEMIGLAYNLVRVPNEVIWRNYYELSHKKHSEALAEARRGIESLEKKEVPIPSKMSWGEFEGEVAKGRKLMVIGEYVVDLNKTVSASTNSPGIVWYEAHPGGQKMLDMFIGKDATEAISGGVYAHHEESFRLFQQLRIAHIDRGMASPSVPPPQHAVAEEVDDAALPRPRVRCFRPNTGVKQE